jgi:hypothetical protein
VRTINRVRLLAGENNRRYAIEASLDGTDWREISTTRTETHVQGGDVKTIVDLRFPNLEARHVRFHGTERNNPAHGYTLFEMMVLQDEPAETARRRKAAD